VFHWIIIGQALLIFAFIAIYASGFASGGVMSGIRLGILLEIAAVGMRLAIYAIQPFPGKLIIYGSVSGLIEMIIAARSQELFTNQRLCERLSEGIAFDPYRFRSWTLGVQR
jgi:hypothetical protein